MSQIDGFVDEAQRGVRPNLIGRCSSGWVVLGDPQVLPGYCVLYPDPVVGQLNDLGEAERRRFLEDMAHIGDAVLRVTDATRINYEILGNVEPALHAHIVPRYAHEDEALRTKPVWFYDWEAAEPFDRTKHASLVRQLREALEAILAPND